MRVLFLSHYYPPEVNAPASRTSEHAAVWSADGYATTVVTCVPNHPQGKIYKGFRNRFLQKATDDGVDVYRMLTLPVPNKGVFWRMVSYVMYLVMVIVLTPFLPKTDIVVSTSPQFFCGLGGYFVSRMKRVPWILEIRDLWPESIVAVGAMRAGPAIRLMQAIETFAYRRADRVVIVSPAFRSHIAARGVSDEKIVDLPNGVDLDRFSPCNSKNTLVRELGLEDKFIVGYVGTHGMAHGLETMLRAAEILRHEEHIVFLFVGDGAERENLQKMCAALELQNVVMLDQLPKNRMPEVWSAISVSAVLLRDKPTFRLVIPSKMFESMATKTPIILGLRGESQKIVEASGAGLCIAPEDADALTATIRSLSKDVNRCKAMGDAGRRFVERHYSRRQFARKYEQLFDEIARGNAA